MPIPIALSADITPPGSGISLREPGAAPAFAIVGNGVAASTKKTPLFGASDQKGAASASADVATHRRIHERYGTRDVLGELSKSVTPVKPEEGGGYSFTAFSERNPDGSWNLQSASAPYKLMHEARIQGTDVNPMTPTINKIHDEIQSNAKRNRMTSQVHITDDEYNALVPLARQMSAPGQAAIRPYGDGITISARRSDGKPLNEPDVNVPRKFAGAAPSKPVTDADRQKAAEKQRGKLRMVTGTLHQELYVPHVKPTASVPK